MRVPAGLVARLLTAQIAVIAVGAVTLAATAAFVGPRLFSEHLHRTGHFSQMVTEHAQEAFESAFAISIAVSMVMALLTAGLVSLLVVRRIAASVSELADAADAIAAADYTVRIPPGGFGTEMTRLSGAFARMAEKLAATEATRAGMLADLSHELRTPLATLEAYIDGMEDQVVPVDAASYAVMREQVARLRRLAIDVRAVSDVEEHALALDRRPADPVELARGAVAFAGPSFAAKGVALECGVTGAVPMVPADPARIQQVLGNLLANALRHTPAGGHVRVQVHAEQARWVCIEVSDDGEGIPGDQLEAIFTRFHRVDPARAAHDGSGAGLGLTIARAIVTGHGGTLTATSNGRGATFTVRLPTAR
jgi:signal transduction histidine kinase